MRRRLRIRFIYTRYPHWCGRSGFTQMARHLDPRYFRTSMDGASDSDEDLPHWLARARPWLRRRIEAGAMPWYKLSDLMAELRAAPGCVGGRYDLVHFLDAEHAGMYLPRVLRRLRLPGPRTVATFHQPPELQHALINPRVACWFDHVTVLSPSQVPFFRQFLPAARIHLLPHGIDTDFFHPPPDRSRTDRIRCITAGHWLRDWQLMREVAMAFLGDPRVVFHVVTRFETGLESMPNVRHHRSISDDELAERYRAADILLLPLHESTANNALLEGIASGLPVVSSDLPGIRYHLAWCESLLAPVGDAQACIEAVRRLQRDPALRQRMGAQSRERAEELQWSRVSGQYAALYRAIRSAEHAAGAASAAGSSSHV